MSDVHIAGTGIWFPEDIITNDEIVSSFNSYVDNFNNHNKNDIEKGNIEAMEYSSSAFIEKASGIKTRHVIDKKNILDINTMMPRVVHEDESRLSIHAKAGIDAAKKAMDQANVGPDDIDGVILGTSHAARNYPSVAIEIQNELGIQGYAYDMLVGCSSTTFAINNAYSDIASGLANTVLVINPEISTPFVNYAKRDIHFIFGDGCVATVISNNKKSNILFLNAGIGSDFYGYKGNGFLFRTPCGNNTLTGTTDEPNSCSWGPIGSVAYSLNDRFSIISEWCGYSYGAGFSIRPFSENSLSISFFATDFIKGFPKYAEDHCTGGMCETRFYGNISLNF